MLCECEDNVYSTDTNTTETPIFREHLWAWSENCQGFWPHPYPDSTGKQQC